ncbi:MAG TPA: methyltransferase [Nitrospirota bacterium]|nr:methyltransferase [Nitrospirota bacterium]
MKAVTHDSISLRGAGIAHITQPKKGARFTLDSILLVDFCSIKPGDIILEPGTGTGIVAILLAKKFPGVTVTAIEIQDVLAELCRENIAQNGLREQIHLIERDIRQLKNTLTPLSFDAIVANPPYRIQGTGKLSPHESRQLSRHDDLTSLENWLDLHRFLKNKARFFLVFPAERLADIIAGLRLRRLEPKRMRLVHSYRTKRASLVLVEAVQSAGPGLEVLAPLVIHESSGDYTVEMRRIYDLL